MAYDAIPQQTTTENQPPRKRLPFVDGSRGLASLWIVCQHFLPHSSDGPLVKSLWRSNCAVDYFIVLSGFVTHWAARGKFSTSSTRWHDARRWYGRRFGRVLLAVWLAMGVSAILLYLGGDGDLNVTHLSLCALLVEPWRSAWNQISGGPRHRRDLIFTQVAVPKPVVPRRPVLDGRGPRAVVASLSGALRPVPLRATAFDGGRGRPRDRAFVRRSPVRLR